MGKGLGKLPLVWPVYEFFYQRLKPEGIVLVEVHGSKMYVDTSVVEALQHMLLVGCVWERDEVELFKKVVKEGSVVVDLGAHIGYYTLLAARLVGRAGRVFALEPEPDNYALLVKNVEVNGYDNVVAVRKAVASRSGVGRLFLTERGPGRAKLSQSLVDLGLGRASITVETVTLDEFLQGNDTGIDFIKMDIEGGETAALLGMDRVIRENEDLKMIVELLPMGITKAGSSVAEFLRKLTEYGFGLNVIGKGGSTKRVEIAELVGLCADGKTRNLFLERDV